MSMNKATGTLYPNIRRPSIQSNGVVSFQKVFRPSKPPPVPPSHRKLCAEQGPLTGITFLALLSKHCACRSSADCGARPSAKRCRFESSTRVGDSTHMETGRPAWTVQNRNSSKTHWVCRFHVGRLIQWRCRCEALRTMHEATIPLEELPQWCEMPGMKGTGIHVWYCNVLCVVYSMLFLANAPRIYLEWLLQETSACWIED